MHIVATAPETPIEQAYLAYLGEAPITASAKPLDLAPYLEGSISLHPGTNKSLPVILSPDLNGTSAKAAQALRHAGFEDIYNLTATGIPQTIPMSRKTLEALVPCLAGHDPDGLIGKSAAIETLRREIHQIAPNLYSVLITGESGTGKECIARALHRYGNRSSQPFVAVNMSALPESLAESELFGHVKGAYTGAISSTHGYFRQAHGGTLFLDEISHLPLSVQAKLLRAVETHQYQPVGSEQREEADVRIITATNQPLEQLIKEGKFLKDLYYRLNVLPMNVPSLRERKSDIPFIATYIALKEGPVVEKGPVLLDSSAGEALQSYVWPGNVRELENAIKRALVFLPEDRRILTAKDFATPASGSHPIELIEPASLHDAKIAWEREFIQRALEATHWNVQQAAKRLGIARGGLYDKIKDFGIERPQTQPI